MKAAIRAWLVMAALACAHAFAEEPAHRDLYLDAMQLLNEGRQLDASDTLKQMIEQEPEHAGAWLDLAIIQCELGYAQEAERLFAEIEKRFDPPPAIREVIAQQRAQGCIRRAAPFSLLTSLSRGYDNNANQGASNPNFSLGTGPGTIELQLLPEYLPQGDQYTSFAVDYMQGLGANGAIGFLQGRIQKNDSLTNYNTASLAVGGEQPWSVSNWQFRGTGALLALNLGGKLYQRQVQLQARATPPLKLPQDWHFDILAGASRIEYPTLEDFNSRMLELRNTLSYRSQGAQVLGSLSYLTDHALAGRPGGDRNGWFANLQGRMQLSSTFSSEFGWSRQHWTSEFFYSPGLIDQRRRQDTQILHAALNMSIAKRHSVNFELRHVDNAENISLFQYKATQFQISWIFQDS